MAKATQGVRLKVEGTNLERNLLSEITLAGEVVDARTVEVGTTEETITLNADITNKGKLLVENRDVTNYVEIGYATGNYPNRLVAGDFAMIPLAPATATLFVKADTAAVKLFFYCTENVIAVSPP